MRILKIAACLITVLLAVTMLSSPTTGLWSKDPGLMVARNPLGAILIASGMMGLAITISRRKGLYKVPVKLAALLLCFYGSALAVSSYMEGLPALVPYLLITLALLLVVFW